MTMKFSDYVKIEQIKEILMDRLVKLGLKEQMATINDEDLNKIITMMWSLGKVLKEADSDEQRTEILMNYIVGLWTRLVVDYGAGIEEL